MSKINVGDVFTSVSKKIAQQENTDQRNAQNREIRKATAIANAQPIYEFINELRAHVIPDSLPDEDDNSSWNLFVTTNEPQNDGVRATTEQETDHNIYLYFEHAWTGYNGSGGTNLTHLVNFKVTEDNTITAYWYEERANKIKGNLQKILKKVLREAIARKMVIIEPQNKKATRQLRRRKAHP